MTRRKLSGHVILPSRCVQPFNPYNLRHTSCYSQVPIAMSQPEDPRAANRAKFELELEFVQSLANPFYLHSLAQQGILNQPAFVNFLKYLLYWKEKDYARFILFVLSHRGICRVGH